MNKAAIIQVYGRVQGVGFRFYTHKKAGELGIKGYVRNQTDGSVYIEATGEAESMKLFTKWCEDGPTWAHVTKMEKQDIPLFQADDFRIR
jgi:acylphosphatase